MAGYLTTMSEVGRAGSVQIRQGFVYMLSQFLSWLHFKLDIPAGAVGEIFSAMEIHFDSIVVGKNVSLD